MGIRILLPHEAGSSVRKVLDAEMASRTDFAGFKEFYRRLYAHKFLVLQNRFAQKLFFYFENNSPQAFVSVFVLNDDAGEQTASLPQHRLGYLHTAPTFSAKSQREFSGQLRVELDALGGKIVGPMNGHVNLGFSLFDALPAACPAFLTAAPSAATSTFYQDVGLCPLRRYDAFRTQVSHMKIRESIDDHEGDEFSVRPLNLRCFKRDVEIYNRLVNQCFVEHPFFEPLTCEEEWDLMRHMFVFIEPRYFQFLLFRNKEIGFCFGLPDYNEILNAKKSDMGNIVKVLGQHWVKRRLIGRGVKFQRGRVIYSGVLPEFRGKGLFHKVRHQVLRNMAEDGIREIESSYVDEENVNSRSNVLSTGGVLSHQFQLWST